MNRLSRRLIKAATHPHLALSYAAALTVFSRSMNWQMADLGADRYFTPPVMQPADRSSLFVGIYEKAERSLLRQFEPADIIVEIGANIGVVARQAFARLNPGGLYVCVEPNPRVRAALQKNMEETARRYGGGRDFQIIAAAVCGGRPGRRDFAVRADLSSGLCDALRLRPDETVETVRTLSLGQLVRAYRRPDKTLSLICDAEGAEIGMLEKDPDAFTAFRNIAIEFHNPDLTGSPATPALMAATLENMGFVAVRKENAGSCCLFARPQDLPLKRQDAVPMLVG